MKNLHKFLIDYSNCPICSKDIFTEIIITFDAFTQRGGVPFKLNIDYVRDTDATSCFKYVKYRDDNDRKYDPGFDKAANDMVVSKDGSFIFDINVFSPSSFIVYGNCPDDHVTIGTREVYLNSNVEENKEIRINREEIQVKNYKIVNDYVLKTTKVYVDGKFPAQLSIRLTPYYILKKNNPIDIISKIESLLILK